MDMSEELPRNEETEKKPLITAKRILRLFLLVCIAFVFCPMFMVSCSGQEIKVDVMTAVGGVSLYGETVVKPHPIMMLCLLIPVVILVLSFVKKRHGKKNAWCSAIGLIADFFLWVIFKMTVEKIAGENFCTCETTGWYYANLVVIALSIITTIPVITGVVRFDTDLIKRFFKKDKTE